MLVDNKPLKTVSSGIPPIAGEPPEANHETEHPSIWMPFSVFIDGQELEGVGISLVAAYVGGWNGPDIGGRRVIARFSFQFDGYSVVLPIDVRADLEFRRAGAYKLVFLDPTGPHLAHLRYMMNAYLAGDMIQLNELLRVPPEERRKAAGKVSNAPEKPGARLRKAAGIGAVVAASLGLLVASAFTIHYHILVHQVPGLATVTPAGLPLTAPEAGQIAYIDSEARQGDVVFSLQSARGGMLNFSNPCDCAVMLTEDGAVGATVLPGTPIAYVKTGDEAPTIKAIMSDDFAKMLLFGAEAIATLPNGDRLPLTLDDVKAEESGPRLQSVVTLSTKDDALGAADIGKTVALTVTSRSYADFLARLRGFLPGAANAETLSAKALDWPLVGGKEAAR